MKTLLLLLLLAIPTFSQTIEETYQEITQKPAVSERKAIFTEQSEQTKIALWKYQFRQALRTRKLNADQRSLLRRLIAAEGVAELKTISAEVRAVFPYKLGRQIFYTLGGDPGYELPFGDCGCTTHSYNYSCSGSCTSGSCSVVAANCGILWLWDCNGSCPTQ